MSDVADLIADGTLCESCGVAMPDGEAPGHPRNCAGCVTATTPVAAEGLDPDSRRGSKPPLSARAHNRRFSPELLAEHGIDFETRHPGHLVIDQGRWSFDFWPGTGRWEKRIPGRRKNMPGVGVRNLIKEIKRLREAEAIAPPAS